MITLTWMQTEEQVGVNAHQVTWVHEYAENGTTIHFAEGHSVTVSDPMTTVLRMIKQELALG